MAELCVFFGHHKCASRYFRSEVLQPVAEALGWPVVTYSVRKAPFHFRRLDELDLYNIDFGSLAASLATESLATKSLATKSPAPRDLATKGPCLVNLSNASVRVVRAIRQTGCSIRGLRVLRDPRQVLVSNYFHHREGHDVAAAGWVWDKLQEDRAVLRRLDLADGLLYELNNISRELFDTQIFGWCAPDDVLEIKLEDYVAQPDAWGARMADHLQVPAELLGKAENRFAHPRGRGWRECFDERLKDVFKARYGDALVRIGYADDSDW
jgi:hypothetical protein